MNTVEIISTIKGIFTQHRRDTVLRVPTFEQFGRPTSNSIPTIIRSFKAVTKKRINEARKILWQNSMATLIL